MTSRQPGTLPAIAFSLALGSFVPSTSSADGRLLHWDNCSPPYNGGTQVKTFGCDSNEGYSDLVVGYHLDDERGLTTGLHAELELGGGDRFSLGSRVGPDYDPLPSYWRLEPGGCRAGDGVVSFAHIAAPSCIDSWQGLPPASSQVTIAYPPGQGATRRLLITVDATWPERTMYNGEYFAFRVRVSHARTTGVDACAGCCLAMTAHIISMYITRSNGTTSPLGTDSDTVVWNETGSPLCGATATRRSTWGLVKGLYR